LRERVRCPAYRAEALGGLVFAYIGPEPAPLLPRYDLLVWDNAIRDIGHALVPCHWLQIMENSVDPVHVEWLHGHCAAAQPMRSGDPVPELYLRRHEKIGFDEFRHGIIKRRLLEGGGEQDDDWKIGHPLIFPVVLRVGAGNYHSFQIRVPVDETHTWHVWYSCLRHRSDAQAAGSWEIPYYEVPIRDERGEWRFDFVDGQDIAVWVSQGAIADRTRERLGDSDRGIVMYRRMLFEEMKRVGEGADPRGVIRDPEENRLVELPQEPVKYGDGRGFRIESMSLGHLRFSPRYAQLLNLADQAG
jgi:5,5'-dehydrodivanillate O-demethylase